MRWILTNQISIIAKKHSNMFSSSKFLNKNKMDWLIDYSNYTRKHLSDLGMNNEVIYINFHNDTHKQSEPDELYAVFESFLLLSEQNLDYNIAAIACEHRGGVYLIIITKEDFERLYNTLDRDKQKSEIVKDLAKIWSDENFYNRKSVTLNENEKYKEKLITEWNDFINSYDNKFKLSCLDRINQYTIWKIIDYDFPVKPGYRIEPGFRSIQKISLEETGFRYACWDEYSNIWVYGETTGLTFIRYDGNENWEIDEIGDEQIPYPIQKVIEVKEPSEK